MNALPIIELIAYVIIGLAGFLVAGGAIFLTALGAYERVENWWLEKPLRKRAAGAAQAPSRALPRDATERL